MDSADINGHFCGVLRLYKRRSGGCSTQAIDEAASRGHLEMVI